MLIIIVIVFVIFIIIVIVIVIVCQAHTSIAGGKERPVEMPNQQGMVTVLLLKVGDKVEGGGLALNMSETGFGNVQLCRSLFIPTLQ